MKAFEKFIQKIGNWGTVVGSVLLYATGVLIVVTVVGRVLHIAFPGTFDLIQVMVVPAIAFAIVFGQLHERHLRADILLVRIKGRLKWGIEIFLSILNSAFWALLLYSGADMLVKMYHGGESTGLLDVPVSPFRAVWVLALFLMFILVSLKIIWNIKNLIKGGQ